MTGEEMQRLQQAMSVFTKRLSADRSSMFAVMTFGQNVIGNFEGVASLFTYMGVTGIAYAVIRYWLPTRRRGSTRANRPEISSTNSSNAATHPARSTTR